MELEQVDVVSDGPVTRVVLDRPERRNALSLELMREVIAAFDALPVGCEAVVLEAAGPAFSAGHDLAEMVARDDEFYDELFAVCTDMMLRLHALPQPVVAKVQGVATAAGCQLVAACDLAVAADTATFATPGVRIGLFCSTPMVPLTRAIGRKRARSRCCSRASPSTRATALAWGLVNQVVPVADLDRAVDALLGQILRFSPRVIGLGKRAFYDQIERAEPDAYEHVRPVMAANAADADAQEGIAAFLGKRPPHWPALTDAAPSHRPSLGRFRCAVPPSGTAPLHLTVPTCASRWRVVECTGSLSNSGSTYLPNVSTDSIAASKGVSSDSEPNDTWSAPIASYFRIVLIASSGVPDRDGAHLDRLVHLLQRDRRLQRRRLVDAGGLREAVEVLRDQRRVVARSGCDGTPRGAVAVLHASSSRW